ncbi:elongation of very long chain fatty acids protein-like isoform X2 [Dinothrombium tinctorium]|uniref:Elongation of very long chain fatty acids protein n=1 Tax=Dinothrombium tinctorium TaxID=1965070 RepID=A0A3S3P887_9ACAR|nr:elongation of very long chain fatty acids protein-like isoform X2 [Dinothrombium tinctorium]RWS15830.1 elongation of very long chain fatty acids protein-like isoform X2 [Dinothrombium tinctorium]RWS17078.1 elongation of very long chain fatty acids protein-like isoform X2 [Dinothrombium tinctorium]
METNVGLMSKLRYVYYDYWQEDGDPRVKLFPMMNGGPWIVLTILAVYLYFVKYLGPSFMKNRQPFDLRRLIFWYNVFLVACNSFFFINGLYYTKFGLTTLYCVPPDPNAFDPVWRYKLWVGWCFFFSKFIDLLDTIFFVLRKKFNQVSTLHVVHHTLMPIMCWAGFKYVPSETVAFTPLINSFVHVVMYSYYALSTMGPKIKPYLWWKKYLTQLQIVQLVLVLIHTSYIVFTPRCEVPKILFVIGLPQVILILAMFCSFFLKTYKKGETNHHMKSS